MRSKICVLLLFLLGVQFQIASCAPAHVENGSPNSMAPSPNLAMYPTDKVFKVLTINDHHGPRNISYFVTDKGHAVTEGDIVYGTEEQILSAAVGNGHGHAAPRAFSFGPGVAPWPQATVRFKYESDDAEAKLSSNVNRAIEYWLSGAPYLRFAQLSPNDRNAVPGILTITADCYSCHANIGYTENNPIINLCPGWCGLDAVTHEFGHALGKSKLHIAYYRVLLQTTNTESGLWHEHRRPDREQYVHFACENLDPVCNNMPADKTCCDTNLPEGCCSSFHDFDFTTGSNLIRSDQYDVNSVMHYPPTAFALEGKYTLVPARPDIVIPHVHANGPTKMDFEQVCKIYFVECPQN